MGGSVCCGHDEQGKYSWTATIMGIWSATGVRSWNWGGKEGVDEEDIWVWTTDVSSIYTIRLAYKAIVSNENFLKEEFFQKNVGQKCSPEVSKGILSHHIFLQHSNKSHTNSHLSFIQSQ